MKLLNIESSGLIRVQMLIFALIFAALLFFVPAGAFASTAISPTAVAAAAEPRAVGWEDLIKLFTPEVWMGIVFALAGLFTPWVTTFMKQVLKTKGDQTKVVNYVIVGLLAGLLPYATGVYGYTYQGLLYAIVVSLLRGIGDQKIYESRQLAAKKAARTVLQETEVQPNMPDGYSK